MPSCFAKRTPASGPVVERLGHGAAVLGLWLPAGLTVVVMMRAGVLQRLFKTPRPVQRRHAPLAVDGAHRIGNLDLALGCHVLHDQRRRKERREFVGALGLQRARV